ncbi:MAG: site-specific DNA-methyltransferase [Cytophagaceae bacterium]|nr:site-specific DNA-methyltransferase [Cytophagaceae bacterium]
MPSLHFKGKTFVQNHHLAVKYHQLVPKKELSLTNKISLHDNLIIQGDNLKALKALLPTYAGKVKCIYIDPPYNTGNEKWVYNDNINSPMIQEWLGKEVDLEDLTRHDKWLCMMMPRLKLLRELLSEEGAIFISCDDNEQHNLRCLTDEVFGENNFLGMFIINSSPSAIDYGHIASQHEYALFYAKNIEKVTANQLSEKDKEFSYEDELGPFNLYPLYNGNVAFNPKTRPNLYYPFYLNPKNQNNDGFFEIDIEPHKGWAEVFPVVSQKEGIPRVWRWGKEKSKENLNKEIVGHITNSGEYRIVQKTRHTSKVIRSLQIDNEVSSRRGTGEVEEIFGKKEFTFPKPIELIKRFVEISTDKGSIILDSFAGSATTAHAVLELNKEDGGNRKFILIEMEDYANTITAERVRRVIKGVKTSKNENLKKGLGGTFSYFQLGDTIEMESLLRGKKLPSFTEFARYLFYTATGEEFNEKAIKEKTGFIGESKSFEVYLFYKPELEWLKKNALTLDLCKALPKFKGKKRLVFAPAKYVDDSTLVDFGIEFCQLPYEIYRLQK